MLGDRAVNVPPGYPVGIKSDSKIILSAPCIKLNARIYHNILDIRREKVA